MDENISRGMYGTYIYGMYKGMQMHISIIHSLFYMKYIDAKNCTQLRHFIDQMIREKR